MSGHRIDSVPAGAGGELPMLGHAGVETDGGTAELSALDRTFMQACMVAKSQKSPISEATNEEKLRLYGYYKQAINGDRRGVKPGLMSFAAVAKWEAWQAMRGMTRERAKYQYISLVIALDPDEAASLVHALTSLREQNPSMALGAIDADNSDGGAAGGAGGGRRIVLKTRLEMVEEALGRGGNQKGLSDQSSIGPPSESSRPESPRAVGKRLQEKAVEMSTYQEHHPDLHIFFIWVDPKSSTRNTQDVWPLPPKYAANVAHWQYRYGADVKVYSGQDCLDNVAMVDEAEEADCGGLLEVYQRLAAESNWIKMVDIARVAIMWLRGGLYLDTDMELGPRTFDHPQLYDDRCWMVQDSDGIVQNHLFRAPPRHAFLAFLLKVYVVNTMEEHHVVKATGPCAVTAALRLYGSSGVWPECRPPVLDPSAPPPDIFCAIEVERLAFQVRARLFEAGYTSASMVPANNGLHTETSLHPPSAFYTHHWREDPGEAGGRSRENCYAVHTWDTTWAPKHRTVRRGYVWGEAYLGEHVYLSNRRRAYTYAKGGGGEEWGEEFVGGELVDAYLGGLLVERGHEMAVEEGGQELSDLLRVGSWRKADDWKVQSLDGAQAFMKGLGEKDGLGDSQDYEREAEELDVSQVSDFQMAQLLEKYGADLI